MIRSEYIDARSVQGGEKYFHEELLSLPLYREYNDNGAVYSVNRQK